MSKICGIYKITSPSGKIYIGQSKDCIKRRSHYKRGRCIGQSRIYNSILKYGWDAHKFEMIHPCLPEELNDLEVYYIQLYQCFNSKHGLNLQSGGKNPTGIAQSKLTVQRRIKSMVKPILQYTMDGNFVKEWQSSKEASISLNVCSSTISEALNGRLDTCKGFIWKRKIKEYIPLIINEKYDNRHKRVMSKEHRRNISISLLGKKLKNSGSFTKEYWENIRIERNSMIF